MSTQQPNSGSRSQARALGTLLVLAGASLTGTAHGQAIYREDFESIPLGPNVEEAVAGSEVWSKAGPTGWVADDSGVPGAGTDTDGITEWAGWSFADKNWWIEAAGDQDRSRFLRGRGTVMIADCDEWDDAAHPGSGLSTDERTAQGLWYNTSITTTGIPLADAGANSLVLVFNSSWRPEFDGDYHQSGRVEAIYDGGTPQEVLLWHSDPSSEFYTGWDDPDLAAEGIYTVSDQKVVLPLDNPAGAQELKVRFTMFDAGNDWWWAIDNIAVGRPPFLTDVSATGIGFSLGITEALGQTVNTGADISTQLDGQAVTTTVEQEDGSDTVFIRHDQSPAIFPPNSEHTVQVSYSTSDGRQITETASFVAPSYATISATPTSVTVTLNETDYLTVNEGAGITFELDGTAVTPSAPVREDLMANDGTDIPDRITVSYTSATPFASSSSHTLKVTFTTATAQQVVENLTFTVPAYPTIPASLGTALGTGADAGMRWRTHQLSASRPNNIAGAEQQLSGALGESIHDNSSETAGGYFEVGYVNFEEFQGAAGHFNGNSEFNELAIPDDSIPGIPGLEGTYDWIAGEALTFVEIPTAGLYTMVVNSDDGFQVSVGTTNNPTYLVLGGYDAGRGAADTQFYFNVQEPGVYLFRLLWFEGDGGASVEWFTINPDGQRALINGPDTGVVPLRSFQRRTVAEPDIPAGTPTISLSRDGAQVTIEYTGTLQSAPAVSGPYAPVAGATSPYTVPTADAARFYISVQ